MKCKICGCTEMDCSQCIEKTGDACAWVEVNGKDALCSACIGEERALKRFNSAKIFQSIGSSRVTRRFLPCYGTVFFDRVVDNLQFLGLVISFGTGRSNALRLTDAGLELLGRKPRRKGGAA